MTKKECEIGTSKAIMEMRSRIAELEKENAELKGIKEIATLIRANNDTVTTLMQLNNMLVSKNQQLAKAKEIIKDYMIIVKGAGTTVCSVPEENRTIYVLKINKKAEQFISEVEE